MDLDLAGIGFGVSVMYLYARALVRVAGKQSLGRLTPMDFVVTLVIGDLFDDVFWAEVPVVQGMTGFGTIVLMHILVTFVTSRSETAHWLLCSPARPLIGGGRLVQKSLQLERIRSKDVQYELRLKGQEHLSEIKEAKLEPNGQVSVIKKPTSKPVQQKDKHLFR